MGGELRFGPSAIDERMDEDGVSLGLRQTPGFSQVIMGTGHGDRTRACAFQWRQCGSTFQQVSFAGGFFGDRESRELGV